MKLNFKEYGGEGDVLVILHGLFGTLDNWTTLARQFAQTHRVFTVDQRNHGKSPHSDDFTYTLVAKDLLEFFEDQGLYTANLLGHSMGGKTAMQFTQMFPESVERLILVDIAPKQYEASHNTIIDALQGLPLAQITSRQHASELLSKSIADFGVRQFLLKNLSRSSNGFTWKMNLPALVRNYEHIIGGLSLEPVFDRPVLGIRGGRSNYVDQHDVETFEETYSSFRIETVADAGHWVHAEKPNELYDLVSEFLKESLF